MVYARCEAHSRVYTSTLTVTSFMPRPAPKKIFTHSGGRRAFLHSAPLRG